MPWISLKCFYLDTTQNKITSGVSGLAPVFSLCYKEHKRTSVVQISLPVNAYFQRACGYMPESLVLDVQLLSVILSLKLLCATGVRSKNSIDCCNSYVCLKTCIFPAMRDSTVSQNKMTGQTKIKQKYWTFSFIHFINGPLLPERVNESLIHIVKSDCWSTKMKFL